MCNYISKAEAINTILGDMQNGESNMEEIFNTALRKAASRIETIPAADVAPVVRGRWKKSYADHEAFGVRPFFRYCSECHEATVYQYNFCPNCGAKMGKVLSKEDMRCHG